MSAIGQQQKINSGSGQNFNSPFPTFIPKQPFFDQISTPSLPVNGHQFSQPPPTPYQSLTPSNTTQFIQQNLVRPYVQAPNNMLQLNSSQHPIYNLYTTPNAPSMHVPTEHQNINPSVMNVNENQPEFNFNPSYYYQAGTFPQQGNQINNIIHRPVIVPNVNAASKYYMINPQQVIIKGQPINVLQQQQHAQQIQYTISQPPINQIQMEAMRNQFQQQQAQQHAQQQAHQKAFEMRADTATPQYGLQKQNITEYVPQMPSPQSEAPSISDSTYSTSSYPPNDIVYYQPDQRAVGRMSTGFAKKPRNVLAIINPDTKKAVNILGDSNENSKDNTNAPNVAQEFYNQVHSTSDQMTSSHAIEAFKDKPIPEFIPKFNINSNDLATKLDISVKEFKPQQNIIEENTKYEAEVNKISDTINNIEASTDQSDDVDGSSGVQLKFVYNSQAESKDNEPNHAKSENTMQNSKDNIETDVEKEATGDMVTAVNYTNENASIRFENIKVGNILRELTPQSSNPSSNDEQLERDIPMQVQKSKKSKNKKKKSQNNDGKSSRRDSLIGLDPGSKTLVEQFPQMDDKVSDPTAAAATTVAIKSDSDEMTSLKSSIDSNNSHEAPKLENMAQLLDSNEGILEDDTINGFMKNSVTLPAIAGHSMVEMSNTSRKSSLQELNRANIKLKEPLSQSGMRLYSREMLLQIRDNNVSQKNNSLLLVNIPADVLRTEDNAASSYNSLPRQTNSTNFADYFTPIFAIPQTNWVPAKRPSQKRMSDIMPQHMAGSMSGGQFGQRVINVSLQQDVQLHTVENAWKSSVKIVDKVENPELEADEKLYKKTRSILNKLTPQNFDTLVDQIKRLPIDTEDKLKKCITIVFEKAISEPSYCIAYARMAQSIKSLEVKSKDNASEKVSFRKLLLNSCQAEFERDNQTELDIMRRKKEIDETLQEEKKKALSLEMNEISTKARRRSLGNIRFIGELFRIKMLTENIMINCLLKLIASHDEDSLECLCGLIRTIGKDLDTPKNIHFIKSFYKDIQLVSSNTTLSLRIRFMLQDVIDLKDNNWVPRRVDNNPKTIEQIHQEARLEDIQKQVLINTPLPPKMQQQQQRSGGGRLSLERPQYQDDSWNMSSSVSGMRNSYEKAPIDVSRMRISKQVLVEDVKLGPSRTNWSTGASGGRSSQEADKNSSSNRFQMLSEDYSNTRNRDRDMYSKTWNRPPHLQGSRGFGTSSRNESPSSNSSRGVSRESSLTRSERLSRTTPLIATEVLNKLDPSVAQAHSTSAVTKQMSLHELERRTKNIFDEYFSILDSKEAFLSIDELQLNEISAHQFVKCVVCHVMEETTQKLLHTGDLLSKLIQTNRIDKLSFTIGLTDALKMAVDLEIDIPRIWQCMGSLLSQFIQLYDTHLIIVFDACQPLVAVNKTGHIFSTIFDGIIKAHGKSAAMKLWEDSGLKWSDLTDESLLVYTSKYHLENISPFMLDLKWRLCNDPKYEKISKWIESQIKDVKRSPMFIRSFTTAICSTAISRTSDTYKVVIETLLMWLPLFKQFLNNFAEEELHVLYALQHLVHSIGHPYDVLYTLFNTMYSNDLISEDAFFEWEKSDDPAELAGKGVALGNTKQFFQRIRESVMDEES